MGKVVIDSSVLLGLFDPKDALHEVSADAVRHRRRRNDHVLVPISVVSEILVGAARQGRQSMVERLGQIRAAFGTPVPLVQYIALDAARLRAEHRFLRLPDAFVLATGIFLDAEILSADKKWANVDPRVHLVQPRRPAP
ncbi:type II toxin-antitoxin system VapC family toxin [Sphaerisporangium album]|uniref:Ribonuclease VapC n=1 Tax=Sphaerisporangium album TaxID=509200 RepID=A0A367FCS0_9ACTN|nr:PIN domain-containing protein [Sphaerisporangium album]RCG28173.1 type II toxin-antitoxin system VapC family toxin [Sphaerisporangium album]